MTRAPFALALASLLGAVTGCSDFERIDFAVSAPPVNFVVTYDEIRIPEGVAVVAIARPMSADGLMSADTKVELVAADPVVLGVAFALPQEFDSGNPDAQWSYILSGVRVGSTTLTVRVDDDVKKEIPALIEVQ